jgi:RNA polymerase sigma factor (sigma-70 family)
LSGKLHHMNMHEKAAHLHQRYDALDDANLVTLTLTGEREAFGPLLLRYYPSVVRLCERLLGPTFDAQDVVQDAALSAFLNLEQLNDPARFGAWLHAIAANLARMALRRRRPLVLSAVEDGAELAVLWSAGPPSPEEVQVMREVHDTIIAALNELSHVNREAVVGFYLEGYSYADLAAILGVPISTLKGRLFFGRQQLRRSLEPLAQDLLKPDHRPRKEHRVEQSELIEVHVDAIRSGRWSPHHVIILTRSGSDRYLPIWIGPFEADAISMTLQGRQSPRPLTHDLTLRLVDAAGAQIQRVVINNLAENTFFAAIDLVIGDRIQTIDARPSDAVALAVRKNAPVYVARSVFETASVTSVADEENQLHQFVRGSSGTAKIQVMIVDDTAETREQLAALLTATPDIELVAQAASSVEAMDLLLRHHPLVALIDAELGAEDGIAAVETLLVRFPHLQMVLMGAQVDTALLKRALRAGAREFVQKPVHADELFQIIRTLHRRAEASLLQIGPTETGRRRDEETV